MPAQIAILDDDHVIRLTRYAISGPGEITEAWAREFFMPEDVDPARGEINDEHRVVGHQPAPTPHLGREKVRPGDHAPMRFEKRLP